MATTQTPKTKTEVFVSYNGDVKGFPYQPNKPVKAFLAEAMGKFHVTNPRHLLAFFDAAGVEYEDEDQTLGEAGVEAGEELTLRTSKVKGG